MTAHALLGSSSAHRWLRCTGSIALCQGEPNNDTPASIEGNVAHRLAEHCLVTGDAPSDFIDHRFEEYPESPVTEEMAAHVARYVEFARSLPGEKLIECRVDYSAWAEGGFGTLDFAAIDGELATLVDLKFGRMDVAVYQNPQLMLYALGLYQGLKATNTVKRFRLVIFQSRTNNVSAWEVSLEDLLTWAETTVKPKAKAALSEVTTLNPGEKQCRFCPAKARCPAFAEFNLSRIVEGFTAIDNLAPMKNTNKFDEHDLATLLPHLSSIRQWADAVEARALDFALQGKTLHDYKLVQKRTRRTWKNQEETANAIENHTALSKDDIYDVSLKSPAKLEKLLRDHDFALDGHITKATGRLCLAPLRDKRPAEVPVNILEGFCPTTQPTDNQ